MIFYLVTWCSLSLEIVRYVRRTMDYSRWKMITRFRINYTHCSSHRYRYSIILFCSVLFTMIILFLIFRNVAWEPNLFFTNVSYTKVMHSSRGWLSWVSFPTFCHFKYTHSWTAGISMIYRNISRCLLLDFKFMF